MKLKNSGKSIWLMPAIIFFSSCAMMSEAIGQSPADPVLSAFRAYKAAQARGDLPAAEAAAKRALSLSEDGGGDKNTTAVLAMNLAITEMNLNHKGDALAPARQALALSRTGAKGVDELQAQLMIVEAELTVDPNADEPHLLAALKRADGRRDLDDYAYPAATALAQAAQSKRRWEVMLEAWRFAERHAPGIGADHQLMLGRALTAQSLALVALHEDQASIKTSAEALQLLVGLAPEAPNDQVSLGEESYAEALAAREASIARQKSEVVGGVVATTGSLISSPAPVQPAPLAERSELSGKPRMCQVIARPEPLPAFPSDMQSDYAVGAVILRMITGADGEVVKTRVLAALPTGSFVTAVSDPKIKWNLTRAPGAKPGCRLDSFDQIVVVRFVLG